MGAKRKACGLAAQRPRIPRRRRARGREGEIDSICAALDCLVQGRGASDQPGSRPFRVGQQSIPASHFSLPIAFVCSDGGVRSTAQSCASLARWGAQARISPNLASLRPKSRQPDSEAAPGRVREPRARRPPELDITDQSHHQTFRLESDLPLGLSDSNPRACADSERPSCRPADFSFRVPARSASPLTPISIAPPRPPPFFRVSHT
jgi:hypothetical protein